MKGHISIPDFIHRVKNELVQAQGRPGDPFYELTEVTLEVSFVLDASAKAGMDLWVAEIGAETKAEQTHKVTLTLVPLPCQPTLEDITAEQGAGQGAASATPSNSAPAPAPKHIGGGGGGCGGRGPVYNKIRRYF